MASKAESEEQLGELAPAGVPALEVDKKGDPARWRDMSKTGGPYEQSTLPYPGANVPEPAPTPGAGGEPAVEETTSEADTSVSRPA